MTHDAVCQERLAEPTESHPPTRHVPCGEDALPDDATTAALLEVGRERLVLPLTDSFSRLLVHVLCRCHALPSTSTSSSVSAAAAASSAASAAASGSAAAFGSAAASGAAGAGRGAAGNDGGGDGAGGGDEQRVVQVWGKPFPAPAAGGDASAAGGDVAFSICRFFSNA